MNICFFFWYEHNYCSILLAEFYTKCLHHNYCSTVTCLCLKKPKKELTYTLDGLINRGGGLISGINIAKMDELISGGGFKTGGLNVGFYGSIFLLL